MVEFFGRAFLEKDQMQTSTGFRTHFATSQWVSMGFTKWRVSALGPQNLRPTVYQPGEVKPARPDAMRLRDAIPIIQYVSFATGFEFSEGD